MKRKSGKRGPVAAKKVSYDGINFASGLERYTYMALKKNKLFEGYENEVFQLVEGFNFDNESFEKQANGKGEYTNRGQKKILGIKYTPDFIGKDYIIECKGRANESFPLRWKLFKLWLTKQQDWKDALQTAKPERSRTDDDIDQRKKKETRMMYTRRILQKDINNYIKANGSIKYSRHRQQLEENMGFTLYVIITKSELNII